eukprot:1299155-Prymnesium_polylepis.1
MAGSRPSVTHGGGLAICDVRRRGRTDESSDWTLFDEEDLGVLALTEYSRRNAALSVSHELAELLWSRKRPIEWALEQNLLRAMEGCSVRDARVRMPYDEERGSWVVKMRARCATRHADQLQRELVSALRRAVARAKETLDVLRLAPIAAKPTAGDLELSRASATRKLGVPIRTNGFFNATGWAEIGYVCLAESGNWAMPRASSSDIGHPLDWDKNDDCAETRPHRTAQQRRGRRDARAHDALRARQCAEARGDVVVCRSGRRSRRRGKLRCRERAEGRENKSDAQEMWVLCGCDDTPMAWFYGLVLGD